MLNSKKICILLLLIPILTVLLTTNIVASDPLVFSTNHTDYYFLVGESAGFVIDIKNLYNETIQGVFSYSVTQKKASTGFKMQSSNSQSKPIIIPAVPEPFVISMGNPDSVVDYVFDSIKFDYTDPGGVRKIVTLSGVTVHIIDDPEQKQDSQCAESTSKTQEEIEQEAKEQREESEKKKEEELRRQMQEHQESKKIQNRMQNNQMNQNTQALKQEMQHEAQEQQQMQQQLKNTIEQDEEFNKMKEELMQEGYEIKDTSISPSSNKSGDFKYSFEDSKGNKAELNGKVEDSKVKGLTKEKSPSLDNLMEKIRDNPDFQGFNNELTMEGFSQTSQAIDKPDTNNTIVSLNYENAKNETATISVFFNEDEIKKVELDKEKKLLPYLIIFLLLLILLGYYIYYRKKETPEEDKVEEKKKFIDYRKDALHMIDEAVTLFNRGRKKDAYGKAAESIRFFYGHKLKKKIEMTNNELIFILRSKKINHESVLKCLNLCSLVEFAKYSPNKKDFDEIIKRARSIIK